MSLTALKKLVQSSKASVLVAVEALMAFMVFRGMMSVDLFAKVTMVLVPTWLVAHAGETGAKALANGKTSNVLNIGATPDPEPAEPEVTDEG